MDTMAGYTDYTPYIRFTGSTLADGTVQYNRQRPFYMIVTLACSNTYIIRARANIRISVECLPSSTVVSASTIPFSASQDYALNEFGDPKFTFPKFA